ncbi:extensin family protein [Rhizobium sullae]|uniref:Extensin n=1 Tax=Rhizobium sullae TaxID=50338 RepID=A0A2N0D582_RHISU|nr:extensin family protein [Rhizobium sullae]PKA41250.1 extensin [Rhizobium sullae]UWU12858.1 extensin family protein [Rhizobium sullae]
MKNIAVAAATTALIILTGASLPDKGPFPQEKPRIDGETEAPAETAPIPEPRPSTANGTENPPTPPNEKPLDTAKPEEKPEKFGPPAPGTLEAQNLTIEPESDADHAKCVRELQALGAVFKDIPRIDDGHGCGIDKPINLVEALPGIAVKPQATLRCPAALALARWMKESVIPAAAVAAKEHGQITTINQASSYICRLRNGAFAGKISEHARGNAIDIASFSFEKGEAIAVKPRREDSTLTGAFQRTVSASGCLYFSTVLDPESDAAHEKHFHLDVLQRKGGYRYCH